jgi:hypothetical protein
VSSGSVSAVFRRQQRGTTPLLEDFMKRYFGVVVGCALAVGSGCGNLVDHRGASGMGQVGPGGGVVESPLGAKLTVPAGALDRDVVISISRGAADMAGALTPIEIEPSGTQFAIPATLSLTYAPETAGPERLKVMTLMDSTWVPVPGQTLDTDTRTLTARLAHLSAYGLVPSVESCSNGHDDDGDGLVDCADPACSGDAACPAQSCTANAACASNQYCRNGKCTPTGFCTANADCAPDYFCLLSQCVIAGTCLNDSQCGAGEQCGHDASAGSNHCVPAGHGESSVCAVYVACNDATQPQAPSADIVYGPQSGCWTNQATADACSASCKAGLAALQSEYPDAGAVCQL